MRKLMVLGALVAASAAPAMAQEISVSGNVAMTTDYHWRNVTQSNQDIAIQGGLDVDFGTGFYLGTWASSVDFAQGAGDLEDTNVELDVYAGYAFSAGGLDWDVGGIYYAYPDSETADLDFFELYAAAGKEFEGGFGLGGSLNWDPDNETVYADIAGSFAVNDTVSIDAGYGAYLEGFGEYAGWNLGGTASILGVDVDLRYYDNDTTGDNDNVVLSVSKSM